MDTIVSSYIFIFLLFLRSQNIVLKQLAIRQHITDVQCDLPGTMVTTNRVITRIQHISTYPNEHGTAKGVLIASPDKYIFRFAADG